VGGDFTANFGSTIDKGKLSSLLRDAVHFDLLDGIIFSLPPTLRHKEGCFFTFGRGVLILSVIVAYHFCHGSARATDVILAAFADDMAHGLQIPWSPFFVVGIIGLMRPTNVEDGLR
jgi:hypothetical protein